MKSEKIVLHSRDDPQTNLGVIKIPTVISTPIVTLITSTPTHWKQLKIV